MEGLRRRLEQLHALTQSHGALEPVSSSLQFPYVCGVSSELDAANKLATTLFYFHLGIWAWAWGLNRGSKHADRMLIICGQF